MRAGVFPFDPDAIDRSRILTTTSFTKHPSNAPISSSSSRQVESNVGSNHDASLLIDRRTTNGDHPMYKRQSREQRVSGFTSSREAIEALDELLRTSESSSDNDDDDDEDKDYVPTSLHAPSSVMMSSPKSQSSSTDKLTTVNSIESDPSGTSGKRKRETKTMVGFDTSDDEGSSFTILCHYLSNDFLSRPIQIPPLNLIIHRLIE